MIVDEHRMFLTQRRLPKMALISADLEPSGLVVGGPGMTKLKVRFPDDDSPAVKVRIWDDFVEAREAGKEASVWLTRFLGPSCKLVFMPDEASRTVRPKYGNSRVSFADAFPILLICEESLHDLNGRLEDPVPMNRFRPNLVVSGCRPYEEDEWRQVRIGSVSFSLVKPCARCVVPAVDQNTGVQGKEPLRTLASYRSHEGKILFGQNIIQDGPGTLSVGDRVEIVSRR
jgi:hypothetical protein